MDASAGLETLANPFDWTGRLHISEMINSDPILVFSVCFMISETTQCELCSSLDHVLPFSRLTSFFFLVHHSNFEEVECACDDARTENLHFSLADDKTRKHHEKKKKRVFCKSVL